jgi:hypothetical protein
MMIVIIYRTWNTLLEPSKRIIAVPVAVPTVTIRALMQIQITEHPINAGFESRRC